MADEMVVAVISAKTDESDSTIEEFEGDLMNEINTVGLQNIRTINSTHGDRLAGPITTVVVAEAETDAPPIGVSSERYQRRKPVFVRANINKSHLRSGEATSEAIDLRDVIRNRGRTNGRYPDDCGHIIGRALNGYMIDYNLFPQQKNINRGIFGNYVFWKAMETSMRLWLTLIPTAFNPRVEFNMLLSYDDASKPDRPSKFKYLVSFYVRLRREGSEEEGGRNGETQLLTASNEILNIAQQAIKNHSRRTMRQKIIDVIRRFDLLEHVKIELLGFVDELEEIFSEVEELSPTPSAPTPHLPSPSPTSSTVYRNRPTTFIDFVPIAGGVKSVYHGAQDFYDGNILKGIGNTVYGATSLAADAVTLGGISTVGKALAKGSTLAIAETVAKTVFTAKIFSSIFFRR